MSALAFEGAVRYQGVMKLLLKGAILGGVIVFLWSAISWMVLPWHAAVVNDFTDEAAVAEVIKANAPRPGMYVLPSMKSSDATTMERRREGPFLFASVRPGRFDFSMPMLMLNSLLIQIAGAFVLTALLLTSRHLTYPGRVLFVVVVTTTGGILSHMAYWNWWEFSGAYTLVTLADLVIGWFLGGLVISWVVEARQ
jgi:hypothetical protein